MGPTPITPTPEDELRRAMAARGLMAPQVGAQPATQPTMATTAGAPAVPARGLTPLAVAPQDPALQANVSRLNTLQSSPSGIGGIHNPVLRTGLQVGDALLSSFLPGLAQGIPGTQLHHNELVREARGNVAEGNRQQQAQATLGKTAADTAESQARVPLIQSQAGETDARTAGLKGEESRAAAGAQGATDYRTAQTREANAKATSLEAPPEKKGDIHVMLADAVADATARGVDPNSDPKVQQLIKVVQGELKPTPEPRTPLEDRIVDEYQKSHPGASLADARKATQANPPKEATEPGTWTLEEGPDGKPILMNSKTGETRPANGVQKSGTAAKAAAATEKEQGPARDAIGYAQNYLKNKVFTGPGDEALQEKFFELAKPSTGFRMSAPQIAMLAQSRSWMSSVAAHIRHATTGTWFDDTQRQQIVDTMNQLAQAKLSGAGGTSGTAGAPEQWSRDASGKLVKK